MGSQPTSNVYTNAHQEHSVEFPLRHAVKHPDDICRNIYAPLTISLNYLSKYLVTSSIYYSKEQKPT